MIPLIRGIFKTTIRPYIYALGKVISIFANNLHVRYSIIHFLQYYNTLEINNK